jgi:uncharacterized protein YbjT (DUF2867 family)
MTKLVTIYGGSGFVGRYIARHMAKQGWRVRVAVRRPNEALFVRPYGAVGQVEPVLCNIRDDASVRAAMLGADAVVNCVGTFESSGKNNFQAVQADGSERVARIAAQEGVARMVQMSALGADVSSDSKYLATKAAGEAAVLAHLPNAMILRPSVIFGTEDEFFNRFAQMTLISPVLPIVGAGTKFQPVHVADVASAAAEGINGNAVGVYELGGPDVADFRSLMDLMRAVIQRRTLVLNVPFWAAGIVANTLGFAQAVTLGLFRNSILTSDQVRSLKTDSVVSQDSKGLADLGIEPSSMEAILPDYLWRFRPSGQYASIKNSAKNLKA